MRSLIIYASHYVLLRRAAEGGWDGLDTRYAWWKREQFIDRGRETWRKVSGLNTCRRVEKSIKLMLKKWCKEGTEFF